MAGTLYHYPTTADTALRIECEGCSESIALTPGMLHQLHTGHPLLLECGSGHLTIAADDGNGHVTPPTGTFHATAPQYKPTRRYNGWTNYPTWDIALWLGNEQELDAEARAIARQAAMREQLSDREYKSLTVAAADALKAWCLLSMPETPAGWLSDITGWAMEQVDWRAIAIHYLDAEGE